MVKILFKFQNIQDENSAPNATPADTNGHTEEPVKKKKMTLSFEEYKTISNMIIFHMRNEETRAEVEDTDSEGLKRSDIIGWYLEQVAEQIENEEELIEKKTLVEKILDRLVYHDQVIIPLRTVSGLKGTSRDAGAQPEEETEDDPVLVVHPNYVIET